MVQVVMVAVCVTVQVVMVAVCVTVQLGLYVGGVYVMCNSTARLGDTDVCSRNITVGFGYVAANGNIYRHACSFNGTAGFGYVCMQLQEMPGMCRGSPQRVRVGGYPCTPLKDASPANSVYAWKSLMPPKLRHTGTEYLQYYNKGHTTLWGTLQYRAYCSIGHTTRKATLQYRAYYSIGHTTV